MQVHVKLLPGGTMPARASLGAAGLDCFANETGVVASRAVGIISLGFCVEVPAGYEVQVRGRSSLAKRGIIAHVGTIDSDYRGEVCFLFYNFGEPYRYERGERVCQMLVATVPSVELVQVDELGATARGPRGFGSTGDKEIQPNQWVACGMAPIPGFNVPRDYCAPFGPSSIGYSGMPYHDLGPPLRPYRVLDGDPSVGESVCSSCGATFAHAEGCPETKK